MYESFFALKEKPFSLTPNPRFLFLSKTHNEVYAHLIYGIENRAGFVEVTGEVGTGKTTILRTLLSHLDEEKYRVAFIFNPKLTAFELIRNINQEFGVADDGQTSQELIQELNGFLLHENKSGRTPILVIDEAQNLSGEVLEQIRLLSNLETEEDKLIQVILVGQPELRRHLSDYSLRQLNQRIAVRYQLRPLNAEETHSYILHRLKIAGRPDSNVFSPAALKRVYKLSEGVPRRINLICDRALLTAFTEERSIVSVKDVNQSVEELDGLGEAGVRSASPPWNYLVGVVIAIAVVIAGWFMVASEPPKVGQESAAAERPPAKSGEVNGRDADVASSKAVKSQLQKSIVKPRTGNDLVESCNSIFSAWGKPLMEEVKQGSGIDIESVFSRKGFNVVKLPGTFTQLKRLNIPMLLPLSSAAGGGYLTVLSQSDINSWDIVPEYQGQTTMSQQDLDKIGVQMAIVPWVDFASIGYVAVPGAQGENVRRLQYLLGLAGCRDVSTHGRFDTMTMNCVNNFQREQNLIVDGLVGPRTLILLYQRAGAYVMPRLN